MTNPAPQTVAVLAILCSRHGSALMTRGDVDSAIHALPNGARISRAQHEDVLRSVAAWLQPSAGNAYVLSHEAMRLLSFAADDEPALSVAEKPHLGALLRGNADA